MRSFDTLGRTISTTISTTIVTGMNYTYDAIGNLKQRTDVPNGNLIENYTCDILNRLTAATSSNPAQFTKSFTYDDLGNLTNKSDTGTYTYAAYRFNGANRPHAVSNIAGSLNASYSYDPNGCAKTAHRASVWRRTPCGCNVLSDGVRSYVYTSFNLPATITKGGATTTLLYGPSHERAKETEADGTVSYNFNPRLDSGLHADYRIKADGTKEYVNYIYAGNRPVGTYTTRTLASGAAGATDLRYFHLDGQGSIIALTNEAGGVVERLSYDAWGKRRNSNGTDDLGNALKSALTDHGYTGHEHLDDMGLIHMNGRVYDPRTGRFLQADPTIQSPGNLQSFNRYSYVMNNPFFYTDPSGFSWLGDRWKAATGTNWADSRDQYVKPIVAIAISAYLPGIGSGFWGAVANGAASGFIYGGITGGTLQSAIQGAQNGAISAGLFYGAGEVARAGIGNVMSHAVAGCLSAAASQGDCKSGALAAAAGSAWTQNGPTFDTMTKNVIANAVVGGVTSVLGGGKFANGAVTAAFAYMFNELKHGPDIEVNDYGTGASPTEKLATFDVEGSSQTYFGSTYPDDPSKFAVVADGSYSYTMTKYNHGGGYDALLISGGGNVPIMQGVNPNTGAVGTANGILVHKGYNTTHGMPGKGSQGCLTVNNENYGGFIGNFKPGQSGKITIRR